MSVHVRQVQSKVGRRYDRPLEICIAKSIHDLMSSGEAGLWRKSPPLGLAFHDQFVAINGKSLGVELFFVAIVRALATRNACRRRVFDVHCKSYYPKP